MSDKHPLPCLVFVSFRVVHGCLLAESMSNAVKENDVEQGGMASYLNRPIVFTLGAEVRKAAYTIHNFTKG